MSIINQQIGLIGNSVKVQTLPTASAKTYGNGNRFYTLISNGHTYRTVVDGANYTWEDVDSLMNPYIATTEDEMEAFIKEKYNGSYIRFENAGYRPNLPITLSRDTEFNLFDVYLGQATMNAYIDKWVKDETEVKVLSYEHQGLYVLVDGSISINVMCHYVVDVYADKILKTDGTYCRALIAAVSYGQNIGTSYDPSTATYGSAAMAIYLNNCTEDELSTLFPEKSYTIEIDGTTQTATRRVSLKEQIVTGWIYKEGNVFPGDTDDDSYGAAVLSQAFYNFYSDFKRLTGYVEDAPVIMGRAVTGKTRESYRVYRNDCTYRVYNTGEKISSYQAESPLQVGDQAAGATWYLNPNFTAEDLKKAQETIPQSEYAGSDVGFLFLNVDNPYKFLDESDSEYAPLWGPMIMGEGSELTLLGILLMYALLGEDSDLNKIFLLGQDTEGNPIDNFKQTSITIPATWGQAKLEQPLTTPATITKINHPEILNQFVGKTATFIATETDKYGVQLVETIGGMIEFGDSRDMDAIASAKTSTLQNKTIRYTGASTDNYQQGALYIVMEE